MEKLPIIISSLTLIGILWGFRDKIFGSGKKEQNLEDRVISLEENYKEMSDDIKTIKTNHLPHIQADIGEIKVMLAEVKTSLKFINKEK